MAPAAFDAVVLAGDRHGSQPVLGESKMFLPLAGAPLLLHVLRAVAQAQRTARIFVVGDQARITEMLAAAPPLSRPVVVLEQGNTFYDNIWTGFVAAAGDAVADPDKAVLFLPGDVPLVTAEERDEFVAGCDLERYDYCLGLTSESTLRAYRTHPGQPPLAIECFVFRGLTVRQNNLHLAKLMRLGNRAYLQRVYELRYQREWRNIARFGLGLLLSQDASLRMVWMFVCGHVARFSKRIGRENAALFRPFLLEPHVVEGVVSRFMRTRFKVVLSRRGGAALDVDDAETYGLIREHFEDWLRRDRDPV